MMAWNFRSCFSSCAAFALAAAAFTPGLARCHEAEHPAKPLLWKIEGKGLTKPSYLFGTLHTSFAAVVKLHPAAEKAFGGADVVYTEVALDAETRLASTPHFLRKDGTKLSESLGKELFTRFEEELKHVKKGLLDERDANMTESAVAALEKEPNLSHFFAAGAAHFASETGIGSRLAKAGYTVTRITE